MNRFYMMPEYANVKSFGNKAVIQITETGKQLYSYETLVSEIVNGHALVYNTQSNTTISHIKEFLLQNGFKADGKRQIINDYTTR